VRVIGGRYRGRPLVAPRGNVTRPTSDRVREAIFSILTSAIDLEGCHVADLFAGSGALGIEAISRGCESSVFVDESTDAVTAIKNNLEALGIGADGTLARVVRSDVGSWVARKETEFDIVFMDPPYGFDKWGELLGRVRCMVGVLESDRPVILPVNWELVKEKRYGGTLVSVVRPCQAEQKGEE
jgi:16S rRNA (guanine966-N2)-methyltransferase